MKAGSSYGPLSYYRETDSHYVVEVPRTAGKILYMFLCHKGEWYSEKHLVSFQFQKVD